LQKRKIVLGYPYVILLLLAQADQVTGYLIGTATDDGGYGEDGFVKIGTEQD
jgi:hypothetical protein